MASSRNGFALPPLFLGPAAWDTPEGASSSSSQVALERSDDQVAELLREFLSTELPTTFTLKEVPALRDRVQSWCTPLQREKIECYPFIDGLPVCPKRTAFKICESIGNFFELLLQESGPLIEGFAMPESSACRLPERFVETYLEMLESGISSTELLSGSPGASSSSSISSSTVEIGYSPMSGATSIVSRLSTSECVKKEIRKQPYLESLSRELFFLCFLQHSNLVKLFFAECYGKSIELFLKHEGEKNLLEQIEEGIEEKKFLEQVASAMDAVAYMHSKGVVHNDIKASNIVQGVLIDLGSATFFSEDPRSFTVKSQPPEREKKEYDTAYASAIDAWQLGIMLYEFYAKEPLHISLKYIEKCSEMGYGLANSEINENPVEFLSRLEGELRDLPIDKPIKALIYDLLRPDPAHRIPMAEAVMRLGAFVEAKTVA